jgi:hypothetical protein
MSGHAKPQPFAPDELSAMEYLWLTDLVHSFRNIIELRAFSGNLSTQGFSTMVASMYGSPRLIRLWLTLAQEIGQLSSVNRTADSDVDLRLIELLLAQEQVAPPSGEATLILIRPTANQPHKKLYEKESWPWHDAWYFFWLTPTGTTYAGQLTNQEAIATIGQQPED